MPPNTTTPYPPDRRRYLDDNYEIHQIKRQLFDNRDAFGNLTTSRTNVLDLASHYPYSPERWRLFVDGSRVYPEYGDVPQYTHAVDVHHLEPAAGETVVLETAERPRYVVQYELAATWAFAATQSLQGDDLIRIGMYDGSDGWYMEHRGDHADAEADFVAERAGTELYRETDLDIHEPVTSFARLKITTGWYKITGQRWDRSFAVDGEQQNPRIGEMSADPTDGPQTGNLPLHYEVRADASGTGIALDAGSCAQVNLGTTTQLTRSKGSEHSHTFATTGSWVPILAVRVDPDRHIVNVQLSDLQVIEWAGADDVNLVAKAHDPSKVLDANGDPLTDADYTTPGQQIASNSVVEVSSAVAQAPDDTGTPTTSASNTGGIQLGRATYRQQGTGQNEDTTASSSDVKRALYGRDTAVIWGRADNLESVVYELWTEQDW